MTELKVPLFDLDIDENDIRNVTEILRSKWLSMGPVSMAFEKKFSEYLKSEYAFGVANGTCALHLAHLAAGIGSGDEVIVPSLTFVATSNSILYCGAKPVFADIGSLSNLNISPDDILEKITPKTKALTIVHYAGYPCNMGAIMEIASDYNLVVIEDVAHAPGAVYNGKKCGSIGDIGCFSFFANKNLSTGEGGMITTDNKKYAAKFEKMRSHAMTSLTWTRHKGHAHSYDVTGLGYNYRINEISSALGINQLEKLDKNNKLRRDICERYHRYLSDKTEIIIPFMGQLDNSSCHIFPILISENVDRRVVIEELRKRGVQSSIHYPPIHLFSYYKEKFGFVEGSLPITESVGKTELTLPLYPNLSEEDLKYVCMSVGASIDEGRKK